MFDDEGVVVHYKNDSRAMHALEHAGGCCTACLQHCLHGEAARSGQCCTAQPPAAAYLHSRFAALCAAAVVVDRWLWAACRLNPGSNCAHTPPHLYPPRFAAAVVADRSHWGRLRLGGEGRLAFLHGQSTADIAALQPGSGCDTVGVCRAAWAAILYCIISWPVDRSH